MISTILTILLEFISFFKKLPLDVQEDIMNNIVSAYRYFFKKSKEDDSDLSSTVKEGADKTWAATTSENITNISVSYMPKSKADKFSESLIELVKSEEFIDELSKRTFDYSDLPEDEYIELCSYQMKTLIKEKLSNS